MSGQDYSPSGTFPSFPLSLVKDGEVYNFDSIQQSSDPKRGLFAKLIDAVGWLKSNLGKDAPATALPDASASSATIDRSVAKTWYVQSPTASTLTVNAVQSSPTPDDGAEIEFAAFNISSGKTVTVQRASAAGLVTMPGPGHGSVRCKFIGGTWRAISWSGVATPLLP